MVAAIRIKAPATLDTLWQDTLPDPGAPGPGEIRVKLAASSLNFHDGLTRARPRRADIPSLKR